MTKQGKKLLEMLTNLQRYVTREEIGVYLGIGDERAVRSIISSVAKEKPIIANSKHVGYKLATSKDKAEVIHTINELKSRIVETQKRIKVLNKFLED